MLLESKDVAYRDIPVDGDAALRAEMSQRAGRSSVPQIWIGDRHIGGCDELYQLERQGQLDELLKGMN